MERWRVVRIVQVGPGGLDAITAKGTRVRYPPNTIQNVPIDAQLEGTYKVLVSRAKIPMETK